VRTLRGKLIVILIAAALTPLIIYGVLSLHNSQQALKRSIHESFREISLRTASEIELYIDHAESLLQTLVQDLVNTRLSPEQTHRIIENYVIRFPQFEKILLWGKGGVAFSTALEAEDKDLPSAELFQKALNSERVFSPAYLSEDLTPVIWLLLPMREGGEPSRVLAAQIDLMQMWDWVSSTKLGDGGYASVVDAKGQVIASGDPKYKREILSSEEAVRFEAFNQQNLSGVPRLSGTSNGKMLMSTVPILSDPPWYLVLSQPAQEAFRSLRTMTWELAGLISLTLAIMIGIAVLTSRRAILSPVRQLLHATQALGRGDLSYRVPKLGQDELGRLGSSFNQMIADLAQLQETTRRQERFAMFGRIASGLAHDLKHPVKNIENAAKAMEVMHEDENFRATFTRIVQREFARINRFLDDLRNLTHEMPYHPITFNLRQTLREIVESFQQEAEKKQASIGLNCPENFPAVTGDPFLLRRVFENLLSNAIQALPPQGGEVEISLTESEAKVIAKVKDNGHGIPPDKINGLFEEFMTTKSRGLGLGLAVSQKIMRLHQGHIQVETQQDKGTCFILTWPIQAA
jgi:Signal transduction histidine kinase